MARIDPHASLPAKVWHPAPFLCGLAVLLGGFLLGWFASRTDPRSDDEWAIDHWFSLHRDAPLNGLAKGIELVDGPKVAPFVLVGIGVLLFLFRRRVMGIAAMIMTFLGWFPGHLAKTLFHRSRPPADVDPIVIYHDQLSYPSGHTGLISAGVVFALFAATMWRRRRAWMIALGALLVAIVGLSRLYAGAHFLLDVLGGCMLATGAGVMLWPAFAEAWVRGQRSGGFWAEPAFRARAERETDLPRSGGPAERQSEGAGSR